MNHGSLYLALSASMAFAMPAYADQYVGVDVFHSSDADGTDITRTALDYDFSHTDIEHYQGLSLETASFKPFGQAKIDEQRIYYRFATGDDWKWTGRVGTDGHTVVGNASVHNELPHRQEYFIERDIIETPLGLQDRLYSTYLGAAFDLPINDRSQLTIVLGIQEFGAENLRLHYRGNFSYTIAPEQGLSAQLRLRYFHDSVANESDYFAPGWYAQAIPTMQMRRYVNGWRYSVAAGYGTQRAADTSWRPARLLEASVTSPKEAHVWSFKAGITYTNTPVNSGVIYDYLQFSMSLGRTF